ncbi:MAG: class I SAM-dependent methyltransferase [Thermoplasmata archaeon]|nr:class I SAM-dependent methyltransferase [Thermoplasmata archaeon]
METDRNLAPLQVRTSTGAVPLAYVRESSRIWLVAQYGAARWAVEVLRSGQANLDLPEGARVGSCRLIADAAGREAVLGRFSQKYGAGQVARWFRPPGRVVEVTLGPDGSAQVPKGSAYFDWLEAEFDSIAADYDHHILGNRINRLLRDRSLSFMRRMFSSNGRLLEVGCGSGTETLELLADGHEILAVDISRRMLDTVVSKARTRGLEGRLRVAKLRAGELSQLLAQEGPASFDGIYSTYGALNCEPDLSPVPLAVAALLRPRGRFVAGVFNRWCGFEIGVFSLLLRPRRAFGRWGRPVAVEASRFCVDAFAYSVPEFCRIFSPQFRPIAIEAAPVLLPPSDLTRYVEMLARRFPTLDALDAAFGRRSPFSWFGDHFLVAMEPTARSVG